MVLENCRNGIREIAQALNISYESTQHILIDILGTKRVAAKLVPKDLNVPSHSIVIAIDFFLSNTGQYLALCHLIRQIWLSVTFSYFRNSNICSEERVMSPVKQ